MCVGNDNVHRDMFVGATSTTVSVLRSSAICERSFSSPIKNWIGTTLTERFVLRKTCSLEKEKNGNFQNIDILIVSGKYYKYCVILCYIYIYKWSLNSWNTLMYESCSCKRKGTGVELSAHRVRRQRT